MMDDEKIEQMREAIGRTPDLIGYNSWMRRKYDIDELRHIDDVLSMHGLRQFSIPQNSFTHVIELDTRLQMAKALNYLVQSTKGQYLRCIVYDDPTDSTTKANKYVAEIIKPLPTGGYYYTQAKEINAEYWGVDNRRKLQRWFIDKDANMYYIDIQDLVYGCGRERDSDVPGNIHYWYAFLMPATVGYYTKYNYEYFNITSTTRVRLDRLMLSTWDKHYKKDDLIKHLNRNPHDNRYNNLVIAARINGGEEHDEERYYNKHKEGPIKKHGKSIRMYDKDGNVLSTFLSIQECCDSTAVSRDKIRYALKTGKDIAGIRFGYATSDPLGAYTEDGQIQPYSVIDENCNVIFKKASAANVAKMLNVPYYTVMNSLTKNTPIKIGNQKYYVRKDV